MRAKMRKSYLFLIALAPLLLLFLRWESSGLLLGNEAYYHLSLAERIAEDPSLIYRNLYLRDFQLTPFHILLSLYPTPIFAQSIVLAFGLLSALLFYRIVQRMDRKASVFSTALLLSSPIFIYLSTFVNADSLPLFLTLLSIAFYMERKYSLSAISVFILAFFPPFNLLFLAALLALYGKERKLDFAKYILVSAIISFSLSSELFYRYAAKGLFADFGSFAGLSLLAVLFGLAGTFILWKEAKWAALLFGIVALFSIRFSNMNIYTNLYVCAVGGVALLNLSAKRWSEESLRKITVFLVFLSILFSTLSYINFAKDAPPEEETYFALLSVNEAGKTILAEKDKSIIVSRFSLEPFIPVFGNAGKETLAEEIFLSRSLERTRRMLETNSIEYILIDDALRARLLESEEGILFLLNNRDVFTEVYSGERTSLYRYRGLLKS